MVTFKLESVSESSIRYSVETKDDDIASLLANAEQTKPYITIFRGIPYLRFVSLGLVEKKILFTNSEEVIKAFEESDIFSIFLLSPQVEGNVFKYEVEF